MNGIKLQNIFDLKKDFLKLEVLTKDVPLNKIVMNSDVNRLGLALAGYLDYFAYDRIQILGNTEIFYFNKLSSKRRKGVIENILKNFDIPCFISTNNLIPAEELLIQAKKHNIPVLKTEMFTSNFVREMNAYVEEEIAPNISMHGVLLEMYGLGVIIVGGSGSGKSECALDLIYKGHQLVCDDMVNIKKKSGEVLVGFASDVLPYHMEIRGMGIVNVKQLLGVSSILDRTNIDLVVALESWDTNKQYDRLGCSGIYENILGIDIPKIIIPVKVGRNLAGLVELAAMKHRLLNQGHDTIKELDECLINYMQKKENNRLKK
ncbi:MAG: HPr(Ser) kinase/phosphatase [Elusimicrobiota bacterium]|jgi:HPr kinase/phosphorylase|nr:HPr(Ser) kinase/phosphatase [Elusimicrobiota bacterium]